MRWFVTGLGLVILFVAALVLAGRTFVDGSAPRTIDVTDGRALSIGPSWPGPLDACVSDASINVLPNCYREPVSRGSFVKEPWSAWSALSFSAVGLLVLAEAGRRGSSRGLWLGAAAISAGFGGVLFHATLTSWGAWAELATAYALFTSVVVIDVLSLLDHPSRGAERGGRVGALVLALGLLAAALVMLVVSEPFVGDPIGLPLHASWHVLAALFVLAFWRYLQPHVEAPALGRKRASQASVG